MSCFTVTPHFLGISCSIQIKNHYFSIFKLNELEDVKKKSVLKGAFLDCFLLNIIIQFLVFLKWVSNLNLTKFQEIFGNFFFGLYTLLVWVSVCSYPINFTPLMMLSVTSAVICSTLAEDKV